MFPIKFLLLLRPLLSLLRRFHPRILVRNQTECVAAHQKQVMSYLEGFEAILEKIKGQVAKIKNAPLSLAMAETISVELEIDHSIKEIRAEIQAQNK